MFPTVIFFSLFFFFGGGGGRSLPPPSCPSPVPIFNKFKGNGFKRRAFYHYTTSALYSLLETSHSEFCFNSGVQQFICSISKTHLRTTKYFALPAEKIFFLLFFFFFFCKCFISQPSLFTPFYSGLVTVSVFMALSTAFHSINSPNKSTPLSHSVLPVLFLSYWFCRAYTFLDICTNFSACVCVADLFP